MTLSHMNLIPNFYDQGLKETSFGRLIQQVFYRKNGHEFYITRRMSNVASHFTVESIAKLLQTLAQIGDQDLGNPEMEESFIARLTEIIRQTSEHKMKLHEVHEFSRIVLDSLKFTRIHKDHSSKYLTEFVFLSSLGLKGDSPQGIKAAFEISLTLIESEHRLLISEYSDKDFIEIDLLIQELFKLREYQKLSQFLLEDPNRAFFYVESYRTRDEAQYLPRLLSTNIIRNKVGTKRIEFADCAESELLNFFRISFNNNNRFNFSYLDEIFSIFCVTQNEKFLNFFKRNPDFRKFNGQVQQEWAIEVVSGLPQIRYLREGQFEIRSGLSNFFFALEGLLLSGSENFGHLKTDEERLNFICTLFSREGKTLSGRIFQEEYPTHSVQVQILNNDEAYFTLKMSEKHVELKSLLAIYRDPWFDFVGIKLAEEIRKNPTLQTPKNWMVLSWFVHSEHALWNVLENLL